MNYILKKISWCKQESGHSWDVQESLKQNFIEIIVGKYFRIHMCWLFCMQEKYFVSPSFKERFLLHFHVYIALNEVLM